MKHVTMSSILLATTLGLTAGLVTGCESTPGKVNKEQLTEIRAEAARIQPGTPRDKALAAVPRANVVRLGSALLDGVTIEEWKVEAFNETGSGRDLFITFLYFANGTLVDQSDKRIDFRANNEVRRRWTAGANAKQ